MKKFNSSLWQAALLIAAIIFATSCSKNENEDTKDEAEDHNEAKFDNPKNEKDAQFLVNAAEINLEEINLGQLAQEKGTSKHVKELGKMMETAHKKCLDDLAALAKTKNITIPLSQTENGQKAYETLSNKSGLDFDKAYANRMVSGHKDAISTFETASNESTDLDIKAWAASILPDLRTHLDKAMVCQKECEKM